MIKLFTPLLKFLNRTLVVILLLTMVVPVTIIAFFSDTETAKNQGFSATEINLINRQKDLPRQYFGPGLNTSYSFSLPINYSASSTESLYDIVSTTNGDKDFCSSLNITAEGYIGSISAGATYFSTGPLTSGTDWQLKLNYDTTKTNFSHGANCEIKITVEAWQKNMTKETAGYHDSYSFIIPVTAHMVVLNEILAKPTTGKPEFIEIYNNSAFPVDVWGWNITELTEGGATTSHIIRTTSLVSADLVAYDRSGNTIVPAYGWLALKYSGNTSYLNDTGDTVTLLDNTGIVIDQHTLGISLTGKSVARIPDGTGLWVDPIPTPNEPNLLDEVVVEVFSEVIDTEIIEASSEIDVEIINENNLVEDKTEENANDSDSKDSKAITEEEEIPVKVEDIVSETVTEPSEDNM